MYWYYTAVILLVVVNHRLESASLNRLKEHFFKMWEWAEKIVTCGLSAKEISYSCLAHKSVKAYATMSIGIMIG